MRYSDIKQRVLDILQYTDEEATRLEYTQKIPRILNECLFRIANSLSMNLREYIITFTSDKLPARVSMPPDFISFADDQDAYLNDKNFILTNFVGQDSIILSGKEVDTVSDTYTYRIFYHAHYPRIIDGVNYESVLLVNKTNADSWEWQKLPIFNMTKPFVVPDDIAELVPHYIVGQLLSLDDKTRSISELNMFETMLAQIDTRRNERQREYQSIRGWY